MQLEKTYESPLVRASVAYIRSLMLDSPVEHALENLSSQELVKSLFAVPGMSEPTVHSLTETILSNVDAAKNSTFCSILTNKEITGDLWTYTTDFGLSVVLSKDPLNDGTNRLTLRAVMHGENNTLGTRWLVSFNSKGAEFYNDREFVWTEAIPAQQELKEADNAEKPVAIPSSVGDIQPAAVAEPPRPVESVPPEPVAAEEAQPAEEINGAKEGRSGGTDKGNDARGLAGDIAVEVVAPPAPVEPGEHVEQPVEAALFYPMFNDNGLLTVRENNKIYKACNALCGKKEKDPEVYRSEISRSLKHPDKVRIEVDVDIETGKVMIEMFEQTKPAETPAPVASHDPYCQGADGSFVPAEPLMRKREFAADAPAPAQPAPAAESRPVFQVGVVGTKDQQLIETLQKECTDYLTDKWPNENMDELSLILCTRHERDVQVAYNRADHKLAVVLVEPQPEAPAVPAVPETPATPPPAPAEPAPEPVAESPQERACVDVVIDGEKHWIGVYSKLSEVSKPHEGWYAAIPAVDKEGEHHIWIYDSFEDNPNEFDWFEIGIRTHDGGFMPVAEETDDGTDGTEPQAAEAAQPDLPVEQPATPVADAVPAIDLNNAMVKTQCLTALFSDVFENLVDPSMNHLNTFLNDYYTKIHHEGYALTKTFPTETIIVYDNVTFSIVKFFNGNEYKIFVALTDRGLADPSWVSTQHISGRWHLLARITKNGYRPNMRRDRGYYPNKRYN